MASPLLLPAALDLERFDRCDSDPLLEAKRPASPSLFSTGLEDSEGEDREDMLFYCPQVSGDSTPKFEDKMHLQDCQGRNSRFGSECSQENLTMEKQCVAGQGQSEEAFTGASSVLLAVLNEMAKEMKERGLYRQTTV